jgi:hypothetical protein
VLPIHADRVNRKVIQAIQAIVDEGPDLGRPLVDRIKGSAPHNLKELRPGSTGSSEIRILFVFNSSSTRSAVRSCSWRVTRQDNGPSGTAAPSLWPKPGTPTGSITYEAPAERGTRMTSFH